MLDQSRSIKTTATLDGDEWVINGHKWFTSNGHAADFYIVMCAPQMRISSGENSKMTQIIVRKHARLMWSEGYLYGVSHPATVRSYMTMYEFRKKIS